MNKQPLGVYIKRSLITGLLALLPVSITVWICVAIMRWADKVVYSVIEAIAPVLNPQNYIDFTLPILGTEIKGIPGMGLIALLVILFVMGVITRLLVFRYFIKWFDDLVRRVPLAGNIYFALKQVMKTISEPGGKKFRKVVLVEFPRKGIYSLGFVTGNAEHVGGEDKTLSLFVPTTPNPTSGFYLMVPERDTIKIDVSVEEAFKLIISAGVLVPDREKIPAI